MNNTQAQTTDPFLAPSKNIAKDLTPDEMLDYAMDGFVDYEIDLKKKIAEELRDENVTPEFVERTFEFLNEKVFDEVVNDRFISMKYGPDEIVAFGRIMEEWAKMERILSQVCYADSPKESEKE